MSLIKPNSWYGLQFPHIIMPINIAKKVVSIIWATAEWTLLSEKMSDLHNRNVATLLMLILLVSAIVIFPYYMTPNPPTSVLLLFCCIPLFIILYSLYLAIFVWWNRAFGVSEREDIYIYILQHKALQWINKVQFE